MSRQFTLGKNERLKSRKQIEQLFKEGQRLVVPPFRIFYSKNNLPISTTGQLKMGIGVSTRFFKKAVDRNRIKRLVRECWRLQKNMLAEKLKEQNKQLNVFLIYTAKELPDYKEVSAKVNKALDKLCTIIDAKN